MRRAPAGSAQPRGGCLALVLFEHERYRKCRQLERPQRYLAPLALGPRRQKEDQRHYYDGGGEKEESEILFPRSAVRRLFYISVIHTISSSSEAGSSASISETVLCDTGCSSSGAISESGLSTKARSCI